MRIKRPVVLARLALISIAALEPVSELENAVPVVLCTVLPLPRTAMRPPPLIEKAVAEGVLMLRPPLLKLIEVPLFVEMVTAALPAALSTLLVPLKLMVLTPLFARLIPVPDALVWEEEPLNVTVPPVFPVMSTSLPALFLVMLPGKVRPTLPPLILIAVPTGALMAPEAAVMAPLTLTRLMASAGGGGGGGGGGIQLHPHT